MFSNLGLVVILRSVLRNIWDARVSPNYSDKSRKPKSEQVNRKNEDGGVQTQETLQRAFLFVHEGMEQSSNNQNKNRADNRVENHVEGRVENAIDLEYGTSSNDSSGQRDIVCARNTSKQVSPFAGRRETALEPTCARRLA